MRKILSFFYKHFAGWDLALIFLAGLLIVFKAQTEWIVCVLVFLLLFHHSSLSFVIACGPFLVLSLLFVEGRLTFPFALVLAVGVSAGFFLVLFGISFLCFRFIRRQGLQPKISPTEKSVLLAGKSGIERGFFTGRPDFKSLSAIKPAQLSPRESDFLNRQTGELCSLSKEWDLVQRRKLSQKTEDFLKQKKFFGLIIPQKYQGLGFSPFGSRKSG